MRWNILDTIANSQNNVTQMSERTGEADLPLTDDQNEKVQISIDLDSEVLEQLKLLTNDPSRTIERAIKQWLKGERDRDTDLTRTFRRNPPLPPRGEWND